MTCRFVLFGRLPDSVPVSADLERVFGSDYSLLALLAWRGIEEVNWNREQWRLARLETHFDGGQGSRVILEARDTLGTTLHPWILFSAIYQPSRAAIGRFLEQPQISPTPEEKEKVYAEARRPRQVAVFCNLGENDIPTPVGHGSAFALLPTGVTCPVGLHIQADWLLVISRREMMQINNNEWHKEIHDRFHACSDTTLLG